MQGMGIYVAKDVPRIVLRTLITVAQLTGQEDAEDELILTAKSDAANLGQKKSSRGVILDRPNLSFGLWVQRTSVLDSLGSSNPMYMVLAL